MFSKFHRKLFYLPKYAKMTDRGVRTRLCLSGLTALLLCAIFASSTFAWFRDQQQLQIVSIHAAEYQAAVACEDDQPANQTAGGTANGYTITVGEDVYYFQKDPVTITLTATGTAGTGYFEIKVGETVYYTEQIQLGGEITLTVPDGTVITPIWGEYSGDADRLEDGAILTGPATDPTEETQPTEGQIGEDESQNTSDVDTTAPTDEPTTQPTEPTPTETTGPTAPETTPPETTAPTDPPATTAPTTEPSTPEPSDTTDTTENETDAGRGICEG